MAVKVINPDTCSAQTDVGVGIIKESLMPKLDAEYKKLMGDLENDTLKLLGMKLGDLKADFSGICELAEKNGSPCLKKLAKELIIKWKLK
ncbi:MAG: hypothetical protein M0R17_01845 [Candidatus Omnitrophica bacterium]|jgi:hypothetical protein|nr:hypothetical protein [Candidatus Omnitrophota bacterium]